MFLNRSRVYFSFDPSDSFCLSGVCAQLKADELVKCLNEGVGLKCWKRKNHEGQ